VCCRGDLAATTQRAGYLQALPKRDGKVQLPVSKTVVAALLGSRRKRCRVSCVN